MFRIALTIGYDGTSFWGSQRQSGKRTVQGELEAALTEFWKAETVTTFAGRTDRGVHAAGQVVSLEDRRPDLSEFAIREAVNQQLPNDLRILAVRRVGGDFHARYDACWREYRYRIWTGARSPLAAPFVWTRRSTPDTGLMEQAARKLLGTHDFSAFAGGGEGVPWSSRRQQPQGAVRTVFLSEIRMIESWWGPTEENDCLIELRIVADGFLPRMVRTVASAVLDVGMSARPVGWIDDLLASHDRRTAGVTAPPTGLTLWQVGYAPWVPRGIEEPERRGERRIVADLDC